MMTEQEQYQALNVLDYLSDLFTASPRESFTTVQILVILDQVRSDPEMFDPEVLIAQQTANAEIDSTPSDLA